MNLPRSAEFALILLALVTGPAAAETVDCLVSPSAVVNLVFPVPGLLATIEADRGQTVKAGDVLARLDSTVEAIGVQIAVEHAEARAGIEAAQARLAAAERQLARTSELAGKALISESDADAARLDRDQAANELRDRQELQAGARLEAERARRLLDQRVLTSPIAGVVVDRKVEIGEYVDRNPVITLATIDPVTIDVIAPATAFGKITPGDALPITLQRPEGERVLARVTTVDPFVDAASGTFRIRASLPNAEGQITAGFRCAADLP